MEILSFIIVPVWLLLCLLSFGYLVAAFSNTIDGRFSHIFNPISIFQSSLFTDIGNKYRKAVLYSFLGFIFIGVIWWQVLPA